MCYVPSTTLRQILCVRERESDSIKKNNPHKQNATVVEGKESS
jgi:hypothetical protein